MGISAELGDSLAQAQDTGAAVGRLDALEKAVRGIEEQLRELNALLRAERRPSPSSSPIEDLQPSAVDVGSSPAKGSNTAKVAIIEFSDFQCPFCGRHAQAVYPDLQRRFVDTGEIKYFFKNFPLEAIHPQALKAAEAAACVAGSGKFWEMHGLIFANQQALAVPDLIAHAKALGVGTEPFESCLNQGKMTARIRDELAEGRRLGVTGTPTFFVGEIEADGRVRVTRKIVGSQPLNVFQSAVDTMLASALSR